MTLAEAVLEVGQSVATEAVAADPCVVVEMVNAPPPRLQVQPWLDGGREQTPAEKRKQLQRSRLERLEHVAGVCHRTCTGFVCLLVTFIFGVLMPLAACVELEEAGGVRSSSDAAARPGPDFMECEGPQFDPVWATFKRYLPERITRGVIIGEEIVSMAAELLDGVEKLDIASMVALFGARLQGDQEAELELAGFCLYGAVAAYTIIALHLDSGLDSLGSGGGVRMSPDSKSSIARALLLLAKKQGIDFMESTSWPVHSMDLVAMLESVDAEAIRALPFAFELPCQQTLGCLATRDWAEAAAAHPPRPPLPAGWPSRVVAVGIHATSTLEAVSALQGAVSEAWGRGGAGGAPFTVQYAGHPCPTHAGSAHQCEMRCKLLGQCGPGSEETDPLAEFVAGAVDMSKFEEKESYGLQEARAALRWAASRRLASLRRADLLVCTFPTVLCVLLNELFPELPLLFVAVANPLFAAPGCTKQEDSTVIDCETDEARQYLVALRNMLLPSSSTGDEFDLGVQGVAAYSVTGALMSYQTGVTLPLAGKAGRYLPVGASWRLERSSEVLVARSRFFETAWGNHFRTVLDESTLIRRAHLSYYYQQDAGNYLPYEDLATFRAVIIFPQDLGLHKFTEHYAMAMPIWMPGREWAYRIQMFAPWGMVAYSGAWRVHPLDDRMGPNDVTEEEASGNPSPDLLDLKKPPWFNAQTVPYPLAKAAFWYEYSEFVAYPSVQHFESIPALLAGLASADLLLISQDMRRYRAELWRTTRAVYAAAASKLASYAAKVAARVADGSV